MENDTAAIMILILMIIAVIMAVKVIDRKITEIDNRKWRKQRGIE